MFKVTFQVQGGNTVEAFANEGEKILQIAQRSNVAIDAPCSGNGSCGKCRVKLLSGELDSKQTRHITDEEYAEGWRLACCSTVVGDVTLEVPDIASAYRSRMKVADLSSGEEVQIFENSRKQVIDAGIEQKNNMEVLDVVMNVPSLEDTMPDNERLMRAVSRETGIAHVTIPYSVMVKLARVLRDSQFHVKCVVRKMTSELRRFLPFL